MSEAEQREIAETLFERTREEIRDAIKLEEERRATLVKNLYRLRVLRLSRDRNSYSSESSRHEISETNTRPTDTSAEARRSLFQG
jgi:hypothetical protein